MKIAVQSGQKTFQQAAAENGQDWKRQIDDMAAVLDYGREKGIELGGVIYGQKAEELDPDAEPDPDDPAALPVALPGGGGAGNPAPDSAGGADSGGEDEGQ